MPSSLKSFLWWFFLSFIEIAVSHGKGSCSSSCGIIQNIKYPFRLRGDPAECGNPDYEFNCEGDHTVYELRPNKYYVTNISYRERKLTLIDVGLANGSCNLPSGNLSSIDYTGPFRLDYERQAVFINCSIINNHPMFEFVPCLSKKNSIIFVTDDTAELGYNCHVLFTVPLASTLNLSVFDRAKLGFRLEWDLLFHSTVDAIHTCATMAGRFHFYFNPSSSWYWEFGGTRLVDKIYFPFRYEFDFLACLHREIYSHAILTFYASTIIFLVLDMILLILVLLIIGRFLFAPLCLLSFVAYNLFMILVPVDIVEKFLQNQQALSPSRFSYNEIITITSNFKEKLGQGGFGSVFKGRLPDGYLVAVKMLGKSMGDGEDFINEVSTIGRIHHVNVVQLVGFCVEGSYRALVYEYMANGSLEKYIFSSHIANRFLSNERLVEIALSVAKGLHYLHQGCNKMILHFDIKPHNILLDHKFTPKISDFGLAKLHPKGHSLVSISAARGTIGYMAPELVSRSFGSISHKSDVYSFGMLLMDMAGRRRHVDLKAKNSSQIYYPSWIYDQLQQEEMIENSDNIIEIDDLEKKLCKVGLCCIQIRPSDRPCMMKVVKMLEADVDSLQMPPKPFFSSFDQLPQGNFFTSSSLCELSVITEIL